MAQIGDNSHLLSLRNLCTNLIIDIGKDGLTGRTDLRVFKGTFHFRQAFAEDIEIKFLHFQFGCGYFLLVFVLLLKLLVFKLGDIIAQFRLTYLVRSSGSEAVQVVLIP